jgi:serine/threonine-protein kinase HipA
VRSNLIEVTTPAFDHDLRINSVSEPMAFGDEFTIDDVRPYDWASFAWHTKTPRSLLAREMRRMARIAMQAAPALAADKIYVDGERVLVERVAKFVLGQAQHLLDMAGPMLEVEEESL